MKNIRPLLALFAILTVLIITNFVIFAPDTDSSPTAQDPQQHPVTLNLIAADQMPTTIILQKDGSRLTIDPETLTAQEHEHITVEGTYISLLLHSSAAIPVLSAFSGDSPNHEYGLSSSETRTFFSFDDGTRIEIILGDRAFDHRSYYMGTASSSIIYTVSEQTAAILFPEHRLIRNSPIPILDAPGSWRFASLIETNRYTTSSGGPKYGHSLPR